MVLSDGVHAARKAHHMPGALQEICKDTLPQTPLIQSNMVASNQVHLSCLFSCCRLLQGAQQAGQFPGISTEDMWMSQQVMGSGAHIHLGCGAYSGRGYGLDLGHGGLGPTAVCHGGLLSKRGGSAHCAGQGSKRGHLRKKKMAFNTHPFHCIRSVKWRGKYKVCALSKDINRTVRRDPCCRCTSRLTGSRVCGVLVC